MKKDQDLIGIMSHNVTRNNLKSKFKPHTDTAMSYQIIWNNSEQEGISDVSVYVFKDNYRSTCIFSF